MRVGVRERRLGKGKSEKERRIGGVRVRKRKGWVIVRWE